jgi:hypothetical protein
MMARSTNRSNQRPDTLMQDRKAAQIDETSCDARPDHTYGSIAVILDATRTRRLDLNERT